MIHSLKKYKTLLIACVITTLGILFYSPFLTVYWLFLPSLFFLYKRQFMYILYIWGFYFGFWYVVFTLVFFDFPLPIIIGGEYTNLVLHFGLERIKNHPFIGSIIGRVTIETIMVTHIICEHYNTTVYIPSLIGGLVKFLSILFGGGGKGGPSVKCSPGKGFKGSSSPGPSPGTSPTDIRGKTIFREPSPASPTVEVSDNITTCSSLTELLSNRKGKLSLSYLFDWESKEVSLNKGLYAIRFDAPNKSFISKNLRGTKVRACIEVEGPILENLYKGGKKK